MYSTLFAVIYPLLFVLFVRKSGYEGYEPCNKGSIFPIIRLTATCSL